MFNYFKLFLCVILLGFPTILPAKTTIIFAGKLLTMQSDRILEKQTIIIKDGKISSIESGYLNIKTFEKNKKVEIIDLKNSFVLPGLIDMHVHLQWELGPKNIQEKLQMSKELSGMRSTLFAKRTLNAGFTTVRDLGFDTENSYALRDAIKNGWVDGPRIIASGRVGITGGHVDVSGMKNDLLDKYTTNTMCDGPYDCRRAARQVIKYGADLIKIASTGGVTTDRNTGTGQQMEMDELIEIVRAAKRMGRKVTAHAHQEEGIIAALKAGVDSIEHASYAGSKSIKLFKQKGAYIVPTLLAGKTVVDMANNSNFFSEAVRKKSIQVGADMINNFNKVYKAGVKIAFGTDSGVSKHGLNAQEAVLMFNAGMPALEIIKTATVNAADLLDMTSELGTIESGKSADIIAVSSSPIDNIKELLDVHFVMKQGEVYKNNL